MRYWLLILAVFLFGCTATKAPKQVIVNQKPKLLLSQPIKPNSSEVNWTYSNGSMCLQKADFESVLTDLNNIKKYNEELSNQLQAYKKYYEEN